MPASGNRWRITTDNVGSAQTTIMAHANCYHGPRPTQRKQSTVIDARGGIASAELIVACPRSKRAISGGFAATPPANILARGPLITASRRAGKRKWKVAATYAGLRGRLTGYAYCV